MAVAGQNQPRRSADHDLPWHGRRFRVYRAGTYSGKGRLKRNAGRDPRFRTQRHPHDTVEDVVEEQCRRAGDFNPLIASPSQLIDQKRRHMAEKVSEDDRYMLIELTFIDRSVHQFHPAIARRVIDGEWSMTQF